MKNRYQILDNGKLINMFDSEPGAKRSANVQSQKYPTRVFTVWDTYSPAGKEIGAIAKYRNGHKVWLDTPDPQE